MRIYMEPFCRLYSLGWYDQTRKKTVIEKSERV